MQALPIPRDISNAEPESLVSPNAGEYNSPRSRILGSLAQLVEHRAFNPLVLGSNPRRPTIFPNLSTSSDVALALPSLTY